MTVAVLFEAPHDPNGWLRWSFHHRDSHNRIRQAIAAKQQRNLPDYPLDPIRGPQIGDFLQYNSQMHIDMNGATEQQSTDLLEVDFEDEAQRLSWINAHALEHRNVEFALGI